MSGFGRARENAEFLEPVANTYQGFFETKRTLFLETTRGLLFECGEDAKEEVVLEQRKGGKRRGG